MVTDQIADLLTRLRNAQRAGHPSVKVPASGTKERVLKVLLDEGYIAQVEHIKDEEDKPLLKIYLKYGNDESPLIRQISRMSRPGRRLYVGVEGIPVLKGGLGVIVVSTSKGMVS